MAANVFYRALEEPAEFDRVVDLEIAVWGLDPRDAVPANMLRAIAHGGGLINGAFVDDELVGMAMMFPARQGDRRILWSHMSAVRPDLQANGIGVRLKQEQRAWALANGYDEICWTFDPLQRGNANFNLRRLGASANTYHVNFYGTMTDTINAGMPSDRLEACWRLTEASHRVDDDLDAPVLLAVGESDQPVQRQPLDGSAPTYIACIPSNLRSLDVSTALAWRLALRETLLSAFKCGYAAVDFLPKRDAVILHKL